MTGQYPGAHAPGPSTDQQRVLSRWRPKRQWLPAAVAAVAGAAVVAVIAVVIIQGKNSANRDLAYEASKAKHSESIYADELDAANKSIGSLKVSLAKPTPTITATVTYTPPPPPGPKTTFDDGTYLVNTDIQPGTYKSDGPGECYWARLSDASGSLDAIIANDISTGPAVVTIAASDVAFKSSGCGTWTLTQ